MASGGTYSCTTKNFVNWQKVLTLLFEVGDEVALRSKPVRQLLGSKDLFAGSFLTNKGICFDHLLILTVVLVTIPN